MLHVWAGHALFGGQRLSLGLGGRLRRSLGRGLDRNLRWGGRRNLRLRHRPQLPHGRGQKPPVLPIVQAVQGGFFRHAQSLGQLPRGKAAVRMAQQPQNNLKLLLSRQLQVAVHQRGGHGENLVPQAYIQTIFHSYSPCFPS